jgi:hypothetical protein
MANLASSLSSDASGEQVSLDTAGLVPVDDGNSPRIPTAVLPVGCNQLDMDRVTARGVIANDVIQDGDSFAQPTRDRLDGPCVHDAMGSLAVFSHLEVPVSAPTSTTSPNPAISDRVSGDAGKESGNGFPVKVVDEKDVIHSSIIPRKPSVGYLYYTCNSHDLTLELAMAITIRSRTA